MKNIFLIIVIFFVNIILIYGQCLDCAIYGQTQEITYTVNQINCGICAYTVKYRECQSDPGKFMIDSIKALNNNPPCCQGTAINDPMVSGYILDEAANQIAQQVGGTITIYTPSKCWQWAGFLGPGPLHNAVLIPCGTAISCCIFHYQDGVLISREFQGNQECRNDPEGCFPLCE